MKKLLKFTPLLALIFLLSSCSSVRVAADYDKNADFNSYKTFAFYKKGIDEADISDLDKRRILKAIESELMAKGMTKSDNPDILVSIFTKSTQRVNVFNNMGWGWGAGWGWGPGWGAGWGNNVSTNVEGQLFIDFIDKKKKEMIWQGSGTGYLVTSSSNNPDKKEARIKEFVSKMMERFPPQSK